MRFGKEIDDQGIADLLRFGSESAERQKHEQQREVDAHGEREAGRAALQRRALVGAGKPIDGQKGEALRVCVAFQATLGDPNLNRE